MKWKEGLTRGQQGRGAATGEMVPSFAYGEERERGGRGGEEGEDVFRCGSCDEKRGERLKTRGGEERKRKEVVGVCVCALFIRADTSESLIHLEKGISQVTTYLLVFTHMHTRRTHILHNYGSGSLQRP